MTTLKITVDTKTHAALLLKMIREFKFVKGAEVEDLEENKSEDQYKKLKAILKKMANKKLFADIENPVEWQKKLRDEWS